MSNRSFSGAIVILNWSCGSGLRVALVGGSCPFCCHYMPFVLIREVGSAEVRRSASWSWLNVLLIVLLLFISTMWTLGLFGMTLLLGTFLTLPCQCLLPRPLFWVTVPPCWGNFKLCLGLLSSTMVCRIVSLYGRYSILSAVILALCEPAFMGL